MNKNFRSWATFLRQKKLFAKLFCSFMEEIKDELKVNTMIGEEILLEIDETLSRLIQNAEAIQSVQWNALSETEMNAFQNTQESLLQHLLHMDGCWLMRKNSLKNPRVHSSTLKIQEKLKHFEQLKTSYSKSISSARKKTPFFSKRKKKSLLDFASQPSFRS
ncbi:MAG: hypothetical protein A3D96_06680 [Chlamydiae bacterium RIFCSPHIGHO2_12_FULL_44_59]|nr:MAG: hypothetical protein A2796_01825 [Chlamydiae bacterium RIFCSPHIGHO2_01_FULL_44_39]OGN59147.1 MAG: hypothetical protein A3C42_01845 [Chlamydiae bacterium RIFCSPHIGHO2_02_FULL_45_9]OGN59766.1 MAG: hypothetical protein A3D96_06680 [Chlamydiae bacterium RIFCSPHIGHO2_12_FULL_44_59]OGN65864.1 MAG: hypothetical protein A2978_05635 [Chlamydiae bacterium RIFCSPLOWO2_01_FULL_44_52]OGN68274.1 MAG: hypothetical protein A3I67_01755 [Chlamydiae bacterium RIFCSPLOWO2_02_FULL_45_22]OGN69584.1 MAG: hyp